MKLSSRKQLLKEADDVLKDISKRRVDEMPLDFERHRKALQRPDKSSIDFINWRLNKELNLIERKYNSKNDPVSLQKERDELIEFAERLKDHVINNGIEIPEDPNKQTELQKLIVNAPPFPKGFDYLKDFAKTLVKDKETGMYWSALSGLPSVPADWRKDVTEYYMDITSNVSYDYSRGWFYNFLRRLLFASSGD